MYVTLLFWGTDKGADVNRTLENGATPLTAAKSQGNASIVALLEPESRTIRSDRGEINLTVPTE